MYEVVIRCDAAQMEDPDLDIRYHFPDFLEKQIVGLEDWGYDYGDPETILELYMKFETPVDLEHLISVAKTQERWGGEVGKGITIFCREVG